VVGVPRYQAPQGFLLLSSPRRVSRGTVIRHPLSHPHLRSCRSSAASARPALLPPGPLSGRRRRRCSSACRGGNSALRVGRALRRRRSASRCGSSRPGEGSAPPRQVCGTGLALAAAPLGLLLAQAHAGRAGALGSPPLRLSRPSGRYGRACKEACPIALLPAAGHCSLAVTGNCARFGCGRGGGGDQIHRSDATYNARCPLSISRTSRFALAGAAPYIYIPIWTAALTR
jgi:hypothetical protein